MLPVIGVEVIERLGVHLGISGNLLDSHTL